MNKVKESNNTSLLKRMNDINSLSIRTDVHVLSNYEMLSFLTKNDNKMTEIQKNKLLCIENNKINWNILFKIDDFNFIKKTITTHPKSTLELLERMNIKDINEFFNFKLIFDRKFTDINFFKEAIKNDLSHINYGLMYAIKTIPNNIELLRLLLDNGAYVLHNRNVIRDDGWGYDEVVSEEQVDYATTQLYKFMVDSCLKNYKKK